MARIFDPERVQQDWHTFVDRQELSLNVDPLIARSWHRCAPRLNPRKPPRWVSLSIDVMPLIVRKNAALLNIAIPILEDCYQYCEGSGTVFTLSDSANCVLFLLGDPDTLMYLEELGWKKGVFIDESRIGTNALSIAVLEASPIQVIGAEHFLTYFHELCTAAAPIFTLEGVPVAVIGMVQPIAHLGTFNVSVTAMAARAIENQLKAEILTQAANLQATELKLVLQSIAEGILVWNSEGIVTHLNHQAGKLLQLPPLSVVGHPLSEYLILPENLARAISSREEIRNLEVSFIIEEQPRHCIVSLRIVRNTEQQPLSYIATLHEIEHIRQLVHRFVGVQARLTLDEIVGKSAAIRRVRRQALGAAKARVSVLLQGEQGAGKNTLARAIHNSSSHASGPFITIHCRAIPRELALGEFLGVEAGAFNNHSTAGQLSKFELADGGTLYLHEIDALPLDTQAALVRVIETGDVIRLGGRRVIPIDVRIIASTTVDLNQKAKEGTFRADLFFRLSAFIIQLVPLRERPEDIPFLIEHLLEKMNVQTGKRLHVDPAAMEFLCRYPYPGNITELESIIERVSSQQDGQVLLLEHLPMNVREPQAWIPTPAATEPVLSIMESERRAIVNAGRAAHANLTLTAQMLGIGRTTLWRKMRELAITIDDLR